MKAAPAAAAAGVVAILLLLLTWLLLRGFDVDARPFDRALSALDQVELAESAMHRDVLSARAGLLRNYDPLSQEVLLLWDAVDQLRGSVADAATVGRLASWLDAQERRLEAFKSANALIRNSLAQFGLLSARLAGPEDGGPAVPTAGALASAMLHLALDTSPEAVRAVERGLDLIAAQPLPPGLSGADAVALLAHGRLLQTQLPVTDRTLRALLDSSSRPEREALRADVLARQEAADHAARRYRLLLYATSVVLLGALVQLGLRLRARALALRRRASFERMLACISTRLISAEPADVDGQVQHALAQVAAHVGADRSYLLLGGPSGPVHAWNAEGTAFPAGWPGRAWALAARLRPGDEGIVWACRANSGVASGIEAELAAAGLRSWIAALRIGASGEIDALLGCDLVGRRARAAAAQDELAPLRLALDAVANAVERAELERERARLEARLNQSRRMEALGTFASGIAHNFNNILGAILGHAELAEARDAAGGTAASSGLAEIRRAGERARDLVEQILAFGRGRAPVRRPLPVRVLVEEAASLLRASLPPDIALVTGQAPLGAMVSGDPAQLQQVLLNLATNAAHAMEGGGTVIVEVDVQRVARAREASQGELVPGDYVVLSVIDSGRGMTEAAAARIFEPFFTSRAAGHGLGLATVREIVLAHGGAIDLQSAVGRGTCFVVWLPQASPAELAAAGAVPPGIAFGRGETLMLIGDDADRQLGDEELLAALGYEPIGFADFAEALDALRATPGRFDAAILCRADPAGATPGLVAELRAAAPALPILLATAETEPPAPRGVAAALRWPFAYIELAATLRRCLPAVEAPPSHVLRP
ncbi:MAG TPA: two-component system VirA-like sensor kinase [Crenalkalicoccus sp.]|nr:two-component system VirA-like sensor kinase [Crenalkalicoccus sp.]